MRVFPIVFLAMMVSINSMGQEISDFEKFFPKGIGLGLGQALARVSDAYISNEKYEGPLTSFDLSWSWFSENRGYRLGLSNSFSEEILNHNTPAEYEQTALFLDFTYGIGSLPIFSHPAYIYIGPGIELFDYYIKHSFASNSRSESEGKINSLGINSFIIWPVNKWFQPELLLKSSLISITDKLYDTRRYEYSDGSIVPFNKSINAYAGFGIRIKPINKFTAKFAYDLNYTRISIWDEYQSINHNFSVKINYLFK